MARLLTRSHSVATPPPIPATTWPSRLKATPFTARVLRAGRRSRGERGGRHPDGRRDHRCGSHRWCGAERVAHGGQSTVPAYQVAPRRRPYPAGDQRCRPRDGQLVSCGVREPGKPYEQRREPAGQPGGRRGSCGQPQCPGQSGERTHCGRRREDEQSRRRPRQTHSRDAGAPGRVGHRGGEPAQPPGSATSDPTKEPRTGAAQQVQRAGQPGEADRGTGTNERRRRGQPRRRSGRRNNNDQKESEQRT